LIGGFKPTQIRYDAHHTLIKEVEVINSYGHSGRGQQRDWTLRGKSAGSQRVLSFQSLLMAISVDYTIKLLDISNDFGICFDCSFGVREE
jgi:hypothetical protein